MRLLPFVIWREKPNEENNVITFTDVDNLLVFIGFCRIDL